MERGQGGIRRRDLDRDGMARSRNAPSDASRLLRTGRRVGRALDQHHGSDNAWRTTAIQSALTQGDGRPRTNLRPSSPLHRRPPRRPCRPERRGRDPAVAGSCAARPQCQRRKRVFTARVLRDDGGSTAAQAPQRLAQDQCAVPDGRPALGSEACVQGY